MVKQSDKLLADILVKNNLISSADINKFLIEAQSTGESLNSFLLRHGKMTEEQIQSLISSQLNLEVINLKEIAVEKAVIDKVPIKFAAYYRFMPVKIDGKKLTLAVSAPLDMRIQDEIRVYLGLDPQIMIAKERDIIESIKKNYGLGAEMIDRILTKEGQRTIFESDAGPWVEDLEKKSEDASVTNLVNQIILEAYKKRATDIHIEPYRNKVRVRYRIDGILVDANIPAEVRHFLLPILSRIKIMANLSIVEKRLPQDGSAVVKTKEQDLDLRVSTIPTPRGESMVIRILPTKVMLFSLEKLGLDSSHIKIFRELVKKPYGIVFVTGPTGSGKTTTLYACLKEINSSEKKIITIEDPIEYEMEGVTQIQVNPRVNLDFSTGLRSILRHDPDILMVGEVRDLETAEIAIRTALTGHLVFSTLHTNDAASGIARLIEMGLEAYLVASSVEAFVAQRLIRIICSQCKEEVKIPLIEIKEEIVAALKINGIDEIKIYRGKGCDHCNHTGFYGRSAIYEILIMNEDIRSAILENPRADHIKRIAVSQGMITLRQDGWRKVIAGVTTPTEVMNVTSKEDYSDHKTPVEDPGIFSRGRKASQGESKTVIDAAVGKSDSAAYRMISSDILSPSKEYEARIYPRINEQFEIRYTVLIPDPQNPNLLKPDGVEHSALTHDISAGGLRFSSGVSLAAGTILGLQIHLEKNERSISCLAKISRIEEEGPKGKFSIMVFYLDISSGDRVKLTNLVKTKMNKS